jgi:hypothetical protein
MEGIPLSVVHVPIKRIIRRMRGGSQPFLVQGEDGFYYVAKFAGNPQGTRTLINEWIAAQLLQRLGISTPEVRLLLLTDSAIQEELLCFKFGNVQVNIEGTYHFGSRCPVDPNEALIMDFLPQPLLANVINLFDFALMLVCDQWLGQTDSRQAIFINVNRGRSTVLRMCSYFIDHGMCFGGSHWEFCDGPRFGVYMDKTVYDLFDIRTQCDIAISLVQNLSEDAIYTPAATLPPDWYGEGDHAGLVHLLTSLERRRVKLPVLMEQSLKIFMGESGATVAHRPAASQLKRLHAG